MRICSLILLLPLVACGPGMEERAEREQAEWAAEKIDAAEGRIPCALDGEEAFAPDCAIDRTHTQDGLFLTVRHPDGGFHRLVVTGDGRGVAAADGAEEAEVSVIGEDRIEVAIGDARYRLPATIGPVSEP